LVAQPLSWPHHVEQQSQGDFQGKAPLPGKIAGIQDGFQGVSVREELLNEFGQEKIGRTMVFCRIWYDIFTA
jgi:hypothetical protein